MKFSEPSLLVEHLSEPDLDFRFSQKSHHPKDGLFLYGPHKGSKKNSRTFELALSQQREA